MSIAFVLMAAAGGAAAGWLALELVNRATNAGRSKIETALVVTASASLIAALSFKFRTREFSFFVYGGLVLVLIGVTLFDIRKHTIPHVVTVPGTIAGLIAGSMVLPLGVRESALGLLVGAGVLIVATLVEALRKKEIGGGDWKYAAMIGSFIGPQRIIIALVFTGIFGAVGAAALALSGHHRKPHALGPWLSAGAVASILLG